MPGFRTEVPHTLSKEDATEKLRVFIDRVRERYKDQVSAIDGAWQENKLDFSLTTFGFTISGARNRLDDAAPPAAGNPSAMDSDVLRVELLKIMEMLRV